MITTFYFDQAGLTLFIYTTMNHQALRVFTKIEDQRHRLLHLLEGITDEQFRKQPAPGRWSLSEIFSHLVASEQMALTYLQKKSLGIQHTGYAGMKHTLIFGLLQLSQRIPTLKFRAPAIVVSHTRPIHSLEEVKQQWNSCREQLRVFLESLPGNDVHKLIYKHPVAGRLSALQGVAFHYEHIIHHWPQIRRLLHSNK